MTQSIPYLRLINQSIADPYLDDPAAVVRSLGAVQAQDYGQSLWAIGLRTKGAHLQDVLDAIESGKILRTWPMRGTIHFVPAEDAKWMVSLTAERSVRAARSIHARVDLGEKDFQKAEEIFREALQNKKRLARPKMIQLLEDNGIATQEQRGYHILWTLSIRGVLYIGPMEGKQQTYALLDEWVPHSRKLERDEGLGELARRYFGGHGPATIADLATWSGQSLADAKIGFELAKTGLTSLTVDGADYWLSRNVREVDPKSLEATYLLAGYEEYLLGYKDRTAVIAPERSSASYSNGIFVPIVVRNGRVIGIWKRAIGPKNIALTFEPFEPLPASVLHEVQASANDYSTFMGQPIVFHNV